MRGLIGYLSSRPYPQPRRAKAFWREAWQAESGISWEALNKASYRRVHDLDSTKPLSCRL